MGYSEIIAMLLVYSGLMAFFLVPFQDRVNSKGYQQSQVTFKGIFKDNLINLVLHKKAILALALLGLTLLSIWLGYAGIEEHYNSHSGYPPINTDLKAIYSICGVLIYTAVLLLLLGYARTLKIVKSVRQ